MSKSGNRIVLPRVYPILDAGTLEKCGCELEPAAAALLEGGAAILQLRVKAGWTRARFEQARRIARLCREAGATFVVNDRADLAALLEAGLHVGQDDLLPADARRLIGPQAVLGFSTHNSPQLDEAAGQPLDYLAFGPVFATVSKEHPDPVVGLERLRECRAAVDLPLVAIGGLTRDNALDALRAGADSLAVIRDLVPEPSSALALRERMEEWQRLVSRA